MKRPSIPCFQRTGSENDNESSLYTYQKGKMENTDSAKSWQECGTAGTFIHCWWDGKMIHKMGDSFL